MLKHLKLITQLTAIRNCDTIHIIGRHDMKDAEYKQNIDRIMDDILRRIADDIKERAIKMHNR